MLLELNFRTVASKYNLDSISFYFKAFGLAGFIKFTQGYHAFFITELAQIGMQSLKRQNSGARDLLDSFF